MNSAMVIFLSLAAAWTLQLVLAGMQSRRFNRRLQELKREGCRTAVGVAGSNLKGKLYVVLVVDEEGTVVRAERLSGWTVFSQLKTIPRLVGMDVRTVSDGVDVSSFGKKLALSAKNAAGFIVAAIDGAPQTPKADKHFSIK